MSNYDPGKPTPKDNIKIKIIEMTFIRIRKSYATIDTIILV